MPDDPFEGLHDPAQFIAPALPWFLADPGAGDPIHADFVVHVPVRVGDGPVSRMVPLFTDEDLAERFVKDLAGRGIRAEPFQLESPSDVAELLDTLEALGVAYASFDPGPGRFVWRDITTVADTYRGDPGDSWVPG